jgi:hypothetical protein
MRTTVRNSYTPKTSDYCNTIVVDEDKGVQYIFDSDGVWTTYTSKQQEGAPMGYVNAKALAAQEAAEDYADNKDAIILQEAKDYADQHGGQVTKQYVDDQDAATLQAAKDYTDAHSGQGGVSQQYVDQQDTITLQSSKDYAVAQDAATLNSAKAYADAQDVLLHTSITSEISTAFSNAPVIAVTDTDPGEGTSLAANHFIAVYGIEESE